MNDQMKTAAMKRVADRIRHKPKMASRRRSVRLSSYASSPHPLSKLSEILWILQTIMPYTIKRSHYAEIYGPTTGDQASAWAIPRCGSKSSATLRSMATNANSAAEKCSATAWARPPESAKTTLSIA